MPNDDLNHIMPPPTQPFQSSGDWLTAEKRLGLSLPGDYKRLVSEYGYGQIGNFLSIFNPHCLNPHANLMSGAVERLEALRVLRAGGENHPYPLYPEAGGVLPVGGTDNGDTLFWITGGLPDDWEIAVYASRGPEWERFPCGLTDFLVGILNQTIRCSIFPTSFPGSDTRFRPFDGDFLP